VTNPGDQSTKPRTAVTLAVHAADSAPADTFAYSAQGLPPGLVISTATGLITGDTTARTGTYDVTISASDSGGARGTTSFTWSVSAGVHWHGLRLQGQWQPAGSGEGTGAPSYAVSGGVVYLSGAVRQKHGTAQGLSVLPSAARPAHTLDIPVSVAGGGDGELIVSPAGVVQARSNPVKAARVLTSLAGVSFPARGTSTHRLSLVNGWRSAQGTAGTGDPSYTLSGGIVYLAGSVHRASGGNPGFAVLPPGTRPAVTMRITVVTAGGSSGQLVIAANGTLSAQGRHAPALTSLAGISFSAAATPATPLGLAMGWKPGEARFGTGDPSLVTTGGIVYLSGSAFSPLGVSDKLAVLPAAARPTHTLYLRASTADGIPGTVLIKPDGEVSVLSGDSGSAEVFTSLAAISYPVNS
jgi:hypothetical protein